VPEWNCHHVAPDLDLTQVFVPKVDNWPSVDGSTDDRRAQDLTNLAIINQFLHRSECRIEASLASDCSDFHVVLFAQPQKLFRFLEILAKRPLDQHILTSLDGGNDSFVVTVYTDSADDEINVSVIGEV
jgi:hypothetical protein